MYLIDGNNVIGQRVGWHRDKPGSRRRFLADLTRFSHVKKVRITVAFDGAPDKDLPDGSSYRGIKIFYSKQGSDADTRIVEMAEAARDRKGLTVVTSDRKLAARVRVCGVQVMRSGQFRRLLDETGTAAFAENTPSVRDEEPVKDEEMDEWLRYFGIDDDQDDG